MNVAEAAADCRLITRMAQGDTTALAEFYDAHSSRVYALAVRIVGQSSDAEEIVQEVYTQAWRQAARYDAGRATVIGWLLMMTRARALDALRARQSRPDAHRALALPELPSAEPGQEVRVLTTESIQQVRQALGELTDSLRIPIELAYYEGLSQTEIAERLEQPLGTIKSRMRTALSKLRTLLWVEESIGVQSANTSARSTPELRVVPGASGFSMLRERYRRPLYALAALAACLLLLACVNIGGLSLSRWLNRRETFAVQLALGSTRSRLAVQLLCEAFLIAGMATLIAVPVAWWGAQLAAHSLWTGSRSSTFQATPLLIALLTTTGVGVIASLFIAAPGWSALAFERWDLGARAAGHIAQRGRSRGVLAAQIALSFVLTFCAALFTENLYGLRQLPLGYEPSRLQWVQLYWTSRTASAPTIGYADTLLSRIEDLPGVELAAMSQGGFGTTGQGSDTSPVRSERGGDRVDALRDQVSPGFFRTTSIQLQQGRDFTWSDVSSGAQVAILNRSLADRLFPTGDAVGRTIRFGRTEQVATVVGVAADASPGDPRIQDVPQYYLPLGSEAPPAPALLLRVTSGSVSEASLRALIEPLGRHEVIRVRTMQGAIAQFLVQERLITSASLLFAALAGLVSIAGLYAAMSQNVTRRRREIGIRIALGATPKTVRTLVVTELCWILFIGLSVGIPGALAGGHLAHSLLSGASTDTASLLLITTVASAVGAVMAAAWPAQRAARIPVATALRSD